MSVPSRHPRPIQLGDVLKRQSLLSNRRRPIRRFRRRPTRFRPRALSSPPIPRSILGQTTGEPKADWRQRLANLRKGQCWSLGPVPGRNGGLQDKPVLVQVTALEGRRLRGA